MTVGRTFDLFERVCDSADNIGTVRYVGALTGAPGVWVGVEWDDAKRGKHSGSYNGIQYFTPK